MRIKRVLQGTALTAFAVVAWLSAGSVDASAEVSISDVTFDEQDASLEIKFTGPELMAGIASVDRNRNAKVAVWDIFEQGEGANKGTAKMDLSKLSVVKDNYIAIMTNDMEVPFYIKLAATAKSNKITFRADTAKISTFKADNNDKVEDVQYRRTTDAWTNKTVKISETEFSEYQYQGAVLYFRVPGIDKLSGITTSAQASDAKDPYEGLKEDQVINAGNNAMVPKSDVYNIGSLPGKEVKLNIAKQANGPSVPVDYKKCKVTIKKKLEYRVIKESGIVSYAAIGSDAVKDVSGILGASDGSEAAPSAILEVRKAAVTKGRLKCASKWTRVQLEESKALAFAAGTVDINAATTDNPVTISTASGAVIEAGYKLNTKKTAVTYLYLTNKTSDNYEFYLGSAVPAVGDKAIKTIKGNKTANLKKDDVGGKNIYIRIAGDKKTKRWAGEWTKAGTDIKVPEVASSK